MTVYTSKDCSDPVWTHFVATAMHTILSISAAGISRFLPLKYAV